jgi:flagellar biosynthesis/type III secretory pathway protein FliH
MKKTAVEYAIQEIEKLAGIKISRDENCIQKANEMFEHQIEDAYLQGFAECDATGIMDCEQYYNETFKSK